MEFRSAHVSIPVDLNTNRVTLNLHAEAGATGAILAALNMDEDRAVEIATIILQQVTALRGARLDRQEALDEAYATLEAERNVVEDFPAREVAQRKPSPCYCDSAYHPEGH